MTSDKAATMQAAAEGLVMAFNGAWDEKVLDAAMASRAPDCIHTMLPRSLGLAPQNNDAWATHFRSVIGMITDSKMTIHDVVVAPEDRRVVVYSSVEATASDGPFGNEYVWFFTFNDGNEIVRIDEMMDSAAVRDIFERRAKAKEESKAEVLPERLDMN